MTEKSNGSYRVLKRVLAVTICIVEMSAVITGVTACGVKNEDTVSSQGTESVSESRQDTASTDEMQEPAVSSGESGQTTMLSEGTQEPAVSSGESGQTTMPSEGTQESAAPSGESGQETTLSDQTQQPSKQGTDGQISLDEAKQAALADAGVSASEVVYTKEKLDYEHGITVYEVEFYADNVEYEYEINAVTGAVHSKSVETHHVQIGRGHESQTGASDAYISDESAKSIALDHAGFSEADVSHIKIQFDMDDGFAEYEIEFYKDGREYEYKISAADGSILEYDLD